MRAYYNDHDSYVAAWLRNLVAVGHLPEGEVDDRSILDVAPIDVRLFRQCHFFAGIGGWPLALGLAGWGEREAWTASLPCQPLSSAGQRGGHLDERHLWPAFYRLVAECRPATIFGEQVASKDGRAWLAGIRADLEHLGYAVGAADLPAAGVGAPHIRQRLFWVASRWVANPGSVVTKFDARLAARSDEATGAGARLGASRSGSAGGLADADGSRRQSQSDGRGSQRTRDGKGQSRVEWISGADIEDGGLAHADQAGSGRVRSGRVSRNGDASHRNDPDRRGAIGGLGDAGISRGRGISGEQSERWREPANSSAVGGLADADGGNANDGHVQRSGEQRQQPQDCSFGGGVAQPTSPRCDGARQHDGGSPSLPARPIERGAVGGLGDAASEPLGRAGQPWQDSVWLPCLDGKARRVEPSIQPLAHAGEWGSGSRVGILRAAGNAIVPQAAAEFIRAVMDSLDKRQQLPILCS